MHRRRYWTHGRIAKALVAAAAAAALPTTAALAQSPGLPRDYDVQRIESPNPIANYHFGWGVASADFTGDGDQDLLVAQSDSFTAGEVFLFDGETGGHIDTLRPPEQNPPRRGGTSAATAYEEFAFVYAEKMADVGSCAPGQSLELCPLDRVGPQDGIPEIIIGSRALHVGPDGQTGRSTASGNAVDPQVGRGYVFDGKTRAVLKRIDMPTDQRLASVASGATGPAFARSMVSPSGLAPCAGSVADANNAGVARCDGLTPADALGDMDGLANSDNPAVARAARADIVVTARGFRETSDDGKPNSAPPSSECATSTSTANPPVPVTCGSGRAWVYRGEDISGSSPLEILDGTVDGQVTGGSRGTLGQSRELVTTLRNPYGQRTGQEYGGNVFRIGDVGRCVGTGTPPGPAVSATTFRCSSSSYNPDGIPEIAIADRTVDYPLGDPADETPDVGATYVYDGATGGLLTTYTHPQPQPDGRFSDGFNAGMAVGDLGNSSLPDLLQGAPGQSVSSAGDGRSYVMNGEATSGRGAQFSILDDATPGPGGQFGSSQTGVGDLAPGAENPANEVMVGSFAPFTVNTEFTNSQLVNDVFIMNPQTERVLQTIPDPDNAPGTGFGVGMTPMGDLNEDGFLDFSISSYLSDAPPNGAPSQGRAFIFRSNNTPLPVAPQPLPSSPRSLSPGSCANAALGTSRADRLTGTPMGDRIFGFRGNDRAESFKGADCLSGGNGDDRLNADSGNDKLLGGNAADMLMGDQGRDRLFGGKGEDVLLGGRGGDLLAGGTGGDRLRGGRGDRLFGEDGNDRLVVRKGARRIDAGAGRDFVHVANGSRDSVNCGTGRRDRARADRFDRLQGCERVTLARRRGERRE